MELINIKGVQKGNLSNLLSEQVKDKLPVGGARHWFVDLAVHGRTGAGRRHQRPLELLLGEVVLAELLPDVPLLIQQGVHPLAGLLTALQVLVVGEAEENLANQLLGEVGPARLGGAALWLKKK